MRILEDGTIEITSNKGNTKIVKAQDLPSYGIPYSDYQKQLEAYKTSVVGGGEEKKDPLAPQKGVASQALDLLESRYGRGSAEAVGTEKDISLGGKGSLLEKLFAPVKKVFSKKELKEDVKSYRNLLETFLPTFTQAFGSGAPQEGEAKRLMKAAPNIKSSNKEATRWFSDIRSLLTGETKETKGTSDDDLINKYKNYGR